jgi:integrase
MIMNYVKETDEDLLLAISFCYYCALRKTEMRKLKIENIDLTKGLILLDGTQIKNKKLGSITLTKHFLEHLQKIRIKKYPAHYYVFGKGLKPATEQCGTNSIPFRHQTMLRQLHQFDLIQDIQGKSFYSWKNTAARDMIEEGVSAPALQKYFHHSSLETTQRYLESFGCCNDSIRDLKSRLF